MTLDSEECEFSDECKNYPDFCNECFLFNLLEKEREEP